MKYTTVIVTPKAQIDYILSHLEVANEVREKAGLKRIGKQELEEKENAPPPAKASVSRCFVPLPFLFSFKEGLTDFWGMGADLEGEGEEEDFGGC